MSLCGAIITVNSAERRCGFVEGHSEWHIAYYQEMEIQWPKD